MILCSFRYAMLNLTLLNFMLVHYSLLKRKEKRHNWRRCLGTLPSCNDILCRTS